MAVFEAMCEWFLGISAHWHLFKYFFMFAFLKDRSRATTIGYANLRMKQGRGDSYIPSSLTSSNNKFIGNSFVQARRNWTDGSPKAEQENLLKDHKVVLTCC
jgi:hypothetical protein